MSLFPWLHYGESMVDFEKSTFFDGEAIFRSVRELPRAILDDKSVDAGGHKNRKSFRKFKKMLGSCRETSKLSADRDATPNTSPPSTGFFGVQKNFQFFFLSKIMKKFLSV